MADKFFEVNGLNVKYGDIQVLWDINFHVEKGEIIAIVGSNGAGKSTTVKTCAGLIKPESGSIKIGGEEVAKGTCRQLIDHGIILIPEGRQLFPGMTIYENLEMGISSAEAKKMKKDTIEQIFTWFPKLKERKKPTCRYAERRRTADGCIFEGDDGTPEAFDDGRAFSWPGAKRC